MQAMLPLFSLLQEDFPLSNQQYRLLSASLAAFSKSGYPSTSVSMIVANARTSKSTFYKHYKNKESILIHLFDLLSTALIRKVEDVLRSVPPTSKRTFQAIKTYIDTCFTHRDAAKLLMVDTVGLVPSLEKKRQAVIDQFASIFQRELSSLTCHRLTKEQWILSHAMVGAINQIVIRSLLEEELPSPVELAGVLEKMMSKLLREKSEFDS
ncbi:MULTISPECIES: TetR/AcrR family transcriptional regulator [Thermoactinomyces]|jgi:AcrR family transcriptional regulator|uniref:TetR/AcrR family transcriptional regulator n=1 Tax=Thermoactinomyces daqus TaxID=1329516 RepID=A0A7W1XBG7_9BACL|nr:MULTISPECIES: TetR/AcrR family transcriptional regulator [Thermoactinomyces]MBA4543574.1 TetR/AcrR family transcriptional regulator [Thermoactinomyces daqus]MBH8596564.1 TetR/AcrR family transcriptional regulator [Thermoactinomyces sp. CICC 10523]MBH8603326.1 TetR/AcrR family transcriptional regulator [Thermoactinomyces sp. CICC 10522]MBH8607907.1 TetR/AcrR family transcriptional regulator [Thermoactinomyces sp. CICC 10521]